MKKVEDAVEPLINLVPNFAPIQNSRLVMYNLSVIMIFVDNVEAIF
jgi:hypothetical protein